MGGKQKQAQRTKGNVKPSSSARAAELLASSGQSGAGFVGFRTLTGDLGYVPASCADDTDNTVDADFRLVLRKLSKRDATTKLKALQELSLLCQEKDTESVKSVLPFWPRIYNKVAVDHDRRVREATQQAFEQFVLRVRRNLAPHLKALMGVWLVAQNDTYAPAATAAQAAFIAAFPPAKQTEALLFCQEEILLHLHENLLVHSVKTFSDAKTTEPEEMEAKFHRVICASLSALKSFLQMVPPEHQLPLVEKHRTMLSDNKFWKYAKHPQAMIQGSFYSVLSAFCKHLPDLSREFSAKIAPIVLHNLDNSDPLVCGPLWEAVLNTVRTIEDCWSHVNIRKGVLPGLWRLLSSGGCGGATVIYPSLLPFLSRIPPDVTTEEFYNEFFNNIKKGLLDRRVSVSPAEVNAIIRAFMECLRLVITHRIKQSAPVNFLIHDQFIPLLASSFLEGVGSGTSSPLYPMTVDFMTYLHKLSPTDAMATRLLKDIVESFLSLNILDSGSKQVTSRYANFLCSFKQQQTLNVRSSKVKFIDDQTEEDHCMASTEPLRIDSPLVENGGEIFEIVCKACQESFSRSQSMKSVADLEFFCQLMRTYSSAIILERVWPEKDLLTDVLQPWIILFEGSVEQSVVDSFVIILHVIFDNTDLKERTAFLSQVLQIIPSLPILHGFLSIILHDQQDKFIRTWIRGAEFGKKMVSVARDLCEQSLVNHGNNLDTHWLMLKIAFSSDEKLESTIGEAHVSEILQVILQSLPNSTKMASLSPVQVEHCIVFICDITDNFFSNVKGCLLLPSAEELLFAIFQFSCQQYNFTDSLIERLFDTWRGGVRALVAQQGGLFHESGFFHRVTEYLKESVRSIGLVYDRFTGFVSASVSLVKCLAESLLTADDTSSNMLSHPSVQELLRELYLPLDHSIIPDWQSRVIVSDLLILDTLPDRDTTATGSVACIVPCAYTSELIATLISDDLAMTEIGSNHALILDQLCSLVLSNIFINSRNLVEMKSDFGKIHQRLEKNVDSLISHLAPETIRNLTTYTLDRCRSEGDLSVLCLRQLLDITRKHGQVIDVMDVAGGIDSFSSLSKMDIQILQQLIPHLSLAVIDHVTELQAALIMTSTPDMVTSISGCRGNLALLSGILSHSQPGLVASTPEPPVNAWLAVLQRLHDIRQDMEQVYLFDSQVRDATWETVSYNIEVIKFMMSVVKTYPTNLTNQAWDSILCSLVSWVQSCHCCQSELIKDPKTQAFGIATFDLVTVVGHCISVLLPEHTDGFPANLATEWSEFFSEGIFSLLLPMFVQINSQPGIQPHRSQAILLSLATSVSLCPRDHLLEHGLVARLVAGDDSTLPDGYQTLLNHLCPILLSRNRGNQIAAYRLLSSVMPVLSAFDEKERADEEDRPSRSPPGALMTVLLKSGHGLQVLLQDVVIGEPVTIEPQCDEYMVTMAYLLSWKLMLVFFRGAKVELRAEYAQYLRNELFVEQLLSVLYKLMPENPVMTLDDILTSDMSQHKLSNTRNMFSELPLLDIKADCVGEEVAHMACSVYYQVLLDLPALIRHWFHGFDKRMVAIVDKYTTSFVSPILIGQELASVQKADVQLANMTIKTRPAAREVVATYTVEEVSMELVVTVPTNHPLGQITVDSGKRIGVATNQWRNWMLQLTTYLHKQNGSILDGLTLWRRNVDKRFDGVEECLICFSVIHGTNCQLPKLRCRTCKKKFHSACLYKWFNTSNNSTCPMCRNLF